MTALAAALVLGGCESAVDFSDWAQGYNKAVEKTQNENVLLNMVRAGYNLPLHFTTVSVVRGNGSTTATISALYPFGYKPDISTSPNAVLPGLSVTGGFNFDMVSLDNSEFTQGLLVPINPTTVNYYVNEGIPREIVFDLLIDRIVISDAAHTAIYTNDPTRADYGQFVDMLDRLLDVGFTTEHVSTPVPVGPPVSAAEAANIDKLTAAAKAGLSVEPVEGTGPARYQLMRTEAGARFCFQAEAGRRAGLPDALLCKTASKLTSAAGGPHVSGEPARPLPFVAKDASVIVYTRSTRDVFNYLGNIIYMQNEQTGTPFRLELQTKEAQDFNYLGHGHALFVVHKNRPSSDDLVTITFRGDTYSVPRQGQGNSAIVMSLASQILYLSTSINLIPATSAVLVR